jgi:hypothetical protein
VSGSLRGARLPTRTARPAKSLSRWVLSTGRSVLTKCARPPRRLVKGAGFDMLLVCGFAFDAASPETAQEFRPDAEGGWAVTAEERKFGKLSVLLVRMNPDLSMGEDLLKQTGAGNLFTVFGETDVQIDRTEDGPVEGRLSVERDWLCAHADELCRVHLRRVSHDSRAALVKSSPRCSDREE